MPILIAESPPTQKLQSVFASAAVAVSVLIMSTGCGLTPGPIESNTPEVQVSISLGNGPETLVCSQGSGGEDDDLPDLASGALQGRVNSSVLYQPVSQVPKATDVNLIVPTALAGWKFRKSPLVVAAGSAPFTISVPDDGEQFIVWLPTSEWTSGASPKIADWAQTSLAVVPCADHPVSFLGGIIAKNSDTCFPITFIQMGKSEEVRKVSLQGNDCG